MNENISFIDYASGIRLLDRSKLAINRENDNNVIIFRHDVSVNIFWCGFVSLGNFSSWSKFHVNIITGSGVMTFFFYKGLTRNRKYLHIYQISGDWGKLGIPNLTRRSLMKCYWILKNAGVTAFTISELLREN